MDKTILKKWLKAGYMEKHVLHPTEEGTPQGGIISPVLANLTLDGLERLLMERFPRVKTGKGALVNFARYADDVRHLTHNEILLTEKGGSEENDLRVISPT
jgi:RNA-directed DNA polymerase